MATDSLLASVGGRQTPRLMDSWDAHIYTSCAIHSRKIDVIDVVDAEGCSTRDPWILGGRCQMS
jgi:hypothetical protein